MKPDCFLCSRKLNTFSEFDFKRSLDKNVLNNQLSIIFLLRKLLQLSPTSCAEFLSSHGNPSSWISYCSHCATVIQEAQVIYQHISKLQAKLKSIQQNVEHMLVKVHTKLSKPSESANSDIGNSIREEVIQRLNDDYSIQKYQSGEITEFEDNVALDDSGVKLETKEELYALYSDDNVDFPNSPETNYENTNESPSFNLEVEDEKEVQGAEIETVGQYKGDMSACSFCGKKYKYLRSLLRHERLCEDEANKNGTVATKLQLEQGSPENEIGLSSNTKCDKENDSPSNETSNIPGMGKTKSKGEKGRKPAICQECNKKCTRPRDLKRHSLNLHFHILGDNSPRDFPCSECEKSFTTEIFKEAHLRFIHKGLIPYRCYLCKKTFAVFSAYQRHVTDSHIKGGEVSCDKCESKFGDQETLDLHKRISHDKNPRPFICPICGKGFRSPDYFKTHNHIIAEKTFTCELCSSSFITGEKLESHHRKIHYEELNLEPVICEKCPSKRRFGSEKELRTHQKADHKISFNFYCTKCKRGFMREEGLQYHMDTKHPPGKNFACSLCGKCFQTHTHRLNHIRSFHNATPKMQCSICLKKFKSKKTLNRHIRDVHSETERVQCPYCPLMFKVSKYLYEHVRQKHNEDGGKKVAKDIQCPHCPMMFSDKSYLINHLKKKHPDEDYQNISLPVTSLTL